MTQSKLVISIYKDQHEDASIALQTLKKRNDDMESRLEEDLTHVQSVTTIGLQVFSDIVKSAYSPFYSSFYAIIRDAPKPSFVLVLNPVRKMWRYLRN